MKKIFLIIIVSLSVKPSLSQTNSQLIGTWKLNYTLQADKIKCDVPKDSTKLIFYKNGTYYWNEYGAVTKGKWKTLEHKIRFSNIEAVNFKGILSDVSYEIELNKNTLIVHQPEGVEIDCPHQYYIKDK